VTDDRHRLRGDVAHLASQPRHRSLAGSLERARDYCTRQLIHAGWNVTEQPFVAPNRLRIPDDGKPGGMLPMRPSGSVRGVNLLARAIDSNQVTTVGTLLIAHLDTVRISPGADDNASGVAVALQVARLLRQGRHDVTIALVDLEELSQLGSRHLVTVGPRPARVICLESVGYFDDRPGAQHLPVGFGMLFPSLARTIRAREGRGDFLAAVHRGDCEGLLDELVTTAAAQELDLLGLLDRRWNGPGQRFTRWVNPLLMDLDRSDHAPFWRAQVPSILITGTAPLRNSRYHRRGDTPDTLDYRRMNALARSLAHVLTTHEPASPDPT
jgi:hypothetical protein